MHIYVIYMNGIEIKKLLLENKMNINDYDYFDNNKTYELNNIPQINISKEILLKKLCAKYGNDMGNYIMSIMKGNENKPMELLKISNNLIHKN